MCPECGHLHTDRELLSECVPADDDAHEFECAECETVFLASASIRLMYLGRFKPGAFKEPDLSLAAN